MNGRVRRCAEDVLLNRALHLLRFLNERRTFRILSWIDGKTFGLSAKTQEPPSSRPTNPEVHNPPPAQLVQDA